MIAARVTLPGHCSSSPTSYYMLLGCVVCVCFSIFFFHFRELISPCHLLCFPLQRITLGLGRGQGLASIPFLLGPEQACSYSVGLAISSPLAWIQGVDILELRDSLQTGLFLQASPDRLHTVGPRWVFHLPFVRVCSLHQPWTLEAFSLDTVLRDLQGSYSPHHMWVCTRAALWSLSCA